MAVKVKVTSDISGFKKGMKNIRKNAKETAKKIGIGLGAGLAVGAVIAKKIVSALDDIDKASQRLGLSAENYQSMIYAMEIAGGSAKSLETAFKTMTTSLFTKTATAKIALDKLGLSFTDLEGLSPKETFEKLAIATSKLTDENTKNGVAFSLFGRAGTKVNSMMVDYNKNMKDALDKGFIISDADVKTAAEITDQMTLLGKQFQQIAVSSGFLIMLQDALKAIQDMTAELNRLKKDQKAIEVAENTKQKDGSKFGLKKEMSKSIFKDMFDWAAIPIANSIRKALGKKSLSQVADVELEADPITKQPKKRVESRSKAVRNQNVKQKEKENIDKEKIENEKKTKALFEHLKEFNFSDIIPDYLKNGSDILNAENIKADIQKDDKSTYGGTEIYSDRLAKMGGSVGKQIVKSKENNLSENRNKILTELNNNIKKMAEKPNENNIALYG